MKWFKRIYLFYLFGFLLHLRPNDPFLCKYFMTHSNFTRKEVSDYILPVQTYSASVLLVFLFLLTGIYYFKSLIVICSIASLISSIMRTCSSSFTGMIISEVYRGISSATEIGYYVYIYGYYEATSYQKASAYVRTFPLLGKIISAGLAQFSLRKDWFRQEQLEYIHLTAITLGVAISLFVPAAKENIYELSLPISTHKPVYERIKERIYILKTNLKDSVQEELIKQWSIWLIWSLWSYNLISVFIQPLWEDLHGSIYNGLVEASLGILSLLAVLMAGFKSINWKKRTIIMMPLLTGLQYLILLSGMAFSGGFILFNYISYVFFGVIHFFVMTAVSAEIAKVQKQNCFGVVFGFVYMSAAVLNTLMVCTVNANLGFYKLKPDEQFFVYFIVFVVIYVVLFLAFEIKKRIYSIMARH